MFYDWASWESVIAIGIIILFIYYIRRPQYMFTKKVEYIHVRTIKKF